MKVILLKEVERLGKIGETVEVKPGYARNKLIPSKLALIYSDANFKKFKEVEKIVEIRKESKQTTLRISYPRNFCIFLSLKGSIAINGVSLTISFLEEGFFEVCLVDHTLQNTNLSNLKKGDKVNLEFDAIAKYLKSLLDAKESETKYEFLKDRGFI